MSLTIAFELSSKLKRREKEMPRDSVDLNDSKQPVKLSLKGFYDLSFLKLVWYGELSLKKIVENPTTQWRVMPVGVPFHVYCEEILIFSR